MKDKIIMSKGLANTFSQEVESFMSFRDKFGNDILTFKENGDILVKGKLIENDKEVLNALKEFFEIKK